MRVHLVANTHRPDALQAAREAGEWLLAHGQEPGFEAETAAALGRAGVSTDEFSRAGLVVAFGGDGTLIRAAHLCSPYGTPLLGVYFGRFGFVTQCEAGQYQAQIAHFLAGETSLQPRMMVEAELVRSGHHVASLHALNEIVLQRAATARMMTFQIEIDGHTITSYPADGIIAATPTGSTAYNLSANGPILDPNVRAILLTAVAPHTLSARPLVVRPESEVRLQILSGVDGVLSADGQTRLHILRHDEVRVRRSPRVTNLVTVNEDDFLRKLSERLFWSKGYVGAPD